MNKKLQNKSLSFFLTRTLLLGIGISKLVNIAGNDIWLSVIIGSVIGTFFIFLITKLYNTNFYQNIKKNNLLNIIIKTTLSILFICLIFYNLLALIQMISMFYLPNTYPLLIGFAFLFIIVYGGEKMVIIRRISEILFFISLFLITIRTIFLSVYFNYEYFLPLINHSLKDILYASFIYAIFTTMPYILLLDQDIKIKENIKNYLFTSFINLIILISFMGVLTQDLFKILTFPEYIILRKIRLLNFIENVENILSFALLIDIFITQTIIFRNFKKLFNKTTSIIIFVISIFIICNILIIDATYTMTIYKYAILFITSIFIISITLLLIKKRLNKS